MNKIIKLLFEKVVCGACRTRAHQNDISMTETREKRKTVWRECGANFFTLYSRRHNEKTLMLVTFLSWSFASLLRAIFRIPPRVYMLVKKISLYRDFLSRCAMKK